MKKLSCPFGTIEKAAKRYLYCCVFTYEATIKSEPPRFGHDGCFVVFPWFCNGFIGWPWLRFLVVRLPNYWRIGTKNSNFHLRKGLKKENLRGNMFFLSRPVILFIEKLLTVLPNRSGVFYYFHLCIRFRIVWCKRDVKMYFWGSIKARNPLQFRAFLLFQFSWGFIVGTI